MKLRPFLASLLVPATLLAVPASAAVGVRTSAPGKFAIGNPMFVPGLRQQTCMTSETGAPAALASLDAAKATAIIGQPSRLQMIAAAQDGAGSATPSLGKASLVTGNTIGALACSPTENAPLVATANPPAAKDIFGSRRIVISRTRFDAAWQRVESRELASRPKDGPDMTQVHSNGLELLTFVNSWTNAHIRYADDAKLYGASDYWADAATTLQKRAGDCEDIAVVKLQLLAAAGFDKRNLMLTIARDLARNADHAMLIVKLDDRLLLLDDSTDRILDASAPLDYRPIVTLGYEGKWLHGY